MYFSIHTQPEAPTACTPHNKKPNRRATRHHNQTGTLPVATDKHSPTSRQTLRQTFSNLPKYGTKKHPRVSPYNQMPIMSLLVRGSPFKRRCLRGEQIARYLPNETSVMKPDEDRYPNPDPNMNTGQDNGWRMTRILWVLTLNVDTQPLTVTSVIENELHNQRFPTSIAHRRNLMVGQTCQPRRAATRSYFRQSSLSGQVKHCQLWNLIRFYASIISKFVFILWYHSENSDSHCKYLQSSNRMISKINVQFRCGLLL